MNKSMILCSLFGICLASNVSLASDSRLLERDKFLSMIRLISSPDNFDEQVVQVYGVLKTHVDGKKIKSAIVCADVESAKRRVRPNCVLLDSGYFSNNDFLRNYSEKYVLVNGLFNRADSVVDMYLGTIEKVQAVELIETP